MGEQVLSLSQQNIQQEQRRFQLKNSNRELNVVQKKSGREQEYRISLLALAGSGRHALRLNWKWLIGAALSLLLMFLLLNIPLPGGVERETYAFYVVLIMSLLSLVFLLLCIRSFSFDYVFYSQYAGVPLVKLMAARPSSQACRLFVSRLEQRIKELQEYMALPVDQQIAGELRTIRRLTEEGVLDSRYYEDAKERLLQLINQNYKRKNTAY